MCKFGRGEGSLLARLRRPFTNTKFHLFSLFSACVSLLVCAYVYRFVYIAKHMRTHVHGLNARARLRLSLKPSVRLHARARLVLAHACVDAFS